MCKFIVKTQLSHFIYNINSHDFILVFYIIISLNASKISI